MFPSSVNLSLSLPEVSNSFDDFFTFVTASDARIKRLINVAHKCSYNDKTTRKNGDYNCFVRIVHTIIVQNETGILYMDFFQSRWSTLSLLCNERVLCALGLLVLRVIRKMKGIISRMFVHFCLLKKRN